jgi:transposase
MFVGIDVAKDRLDVHVRPAGESFAVARDGEGIEELVKRLAAVTPSLIVLEATGGFETVVAAGLAAAGLPLAVVNPLQIRDFARATARLAKTDTLDAAVIAHFAEAVNPPPRPLADPQQRLLGELMARRRQLIEMMVAEGNRRRLLTFRRTLKSVDRVLATLKAQLEDIDHDIDIAVRGTPAWREAEDLLISVPGIGPKIARTPARRNARARPARSTPDRLADRGCSLQSRQWHPARPPNHRRRQDRRAQRSLHERARLDPPKAAAGRDLSSPESLRKTRQGRHRRLHA